MKHRNYINHGYLTIAFLGLISVIILPSISKAETGNEKNESSIKSTLLECTRTNLKTFSDSEEEKVENTYSSPDGELQKLSNDTSKGVLLSDLKPSSSVKCPLNPSPWLNFSQSNAERLDKEKKAMSKGIKPIYGNDNRLDWGEIKSLAVYKNAKASVALFTSNVFTRTSNNSFKLRAYSHGRANNLCKGEPFRKQLAGSFCSGVLVEKNLIATAGHCIRKISKDGVPISKIRFVFDFHAKSKKHSGNSNFKNERIFFGKKVLAGKLSAGGEDWAIVKLDRDVPENIAKPVQIRSSKDLRIQQRLYVIGYPSGVPLKYAPGGSVRDNKSGSHLITNLDTFGGNSGSGVFLNNTHELIGLLVRGADDYYYDQKRKCYRAYRCSINGCGGEDVQRIELAIDKLKK